MRTGSTGNNRGIVSLRPASALLAVGFLCGSLLGMAIPNYPEAAIGPVAAVTGLSVVASTPLALMAAGFSLGILTAVIPEKYRTGTNSPDITGTMEGRVLSVASGVAGGGVATVSVDRVFLPRPVTVRFKARLRFSGGPMPFAGDLIRAPVHLIQFESANRPGLRYLGNVDPRGWALIREGGYLSHLRRKIRNSLLKGGERFGPSATGMLASIALGDKSLLPAETSRAMRHTGIYHLLAVSGVHLAAALLMGILLARPLGAAIAGAGRPGLSLEIRVVAGGLFCILYLCITGISPSAARAGVFAALTALALMTKREIHPINVLALCYLAIGSFSTVPQPGVSLALSMLACLGIFASVGRGPRDLTSAMRVSAGAFIFTLPLVVTVFRGIPFLAPAINLIVGVPFAAMLIPGVVLGDVLSVVLPQGANIVFAVCAGLGKIFSVFIAALGSVRWIYLPLNEYGCAVAAAAGVLCAFLWIRWRGNLGRGVVLIILISSAALAGNFLGDMFVYNRLVMQFPGLGQADAAVLRASGKTVMVDTGPPGVGLRSPPIARMMEREGIRRIDVIILTHPHPDHVGGVAFLMKNWDVGEVVLPQTMQAFDLWRKVLTTVPPGTVVRFLARGDSIRVGEMEFEAMAPFSELYRDGDDLNGLSLVMLLHWRKFTALFTGDAPWGSVEKIIGRLDSLYLLKVPHHGSARGFDPVAMKRIGTIKGVFRKLLAVFTSDPLGERALPSLKVVRWFERAGARFLLTGRGEGVNIICRFPRKWRKGEVGKVDIHYGF